MKDLIKELIHDFYWNMDINCAKTTLLCLSKMLGVPIEPQTLHSATGLHGAGGFQAQCGLVEGSLMYIGIYFKEKGKTDGEVSDICFQFAGKFKERFSSLSCQQLRPNGFNEDDPPHACEILTGEAITFTYDFIKNIQV